MKHLLPVLLLFFSVFLYGQSGFSGGGSPTTLDVQVFPNPAVEYIAVKGDDQRQIARVVIFNIVGRKMDEYRLTSPGQKVDIGKLQRGMYMVQLIDRSNKVVKTQRIQKY